MQGGADGPWSRAHGRREILTLGASKMTVFPVKSKTLWKLVAASCLCIAMVGRASAASGAVVALGNNTYSITREAKNAFQRDVDKLKSEATDAATKFCADQGKEMRVVSLTGVLPTFSLGYAKAKIVFRAVNPGEPDPVVAPAASAYVPVAERRLTTDELYSELVKLDDLRKKGILTDDEFQAEKRKLLARSN